MTKPLTPEERDAKKKARDEAAATTPRADTQLDLHTDAARVGGAPERTEIDTDSVLEELERNGLVEHESKPPFVDPNAEIARRTGADRNDPRVHVGGYSRDYDEHRTPGGDRIEIARPSICRAVIVRRLCSTPDGPIVPSEPVAATVQRADGLVIDCYAVGKLDVDGGGPRGGLHELKGVKHSSLADHDDLYWDYPTRV